MPTQSTQRDVLFSSLSVIAPFVLMLHSMHFIYSHLGLPQVPAGIPTNPLGTQLLGKRFQDCKSAGIEGYRTNHSLRATATTRLYKAGVDEQLVMECTGHHSVDGVRCYKRTNDKQREALSDIINRTPARSATAQSTAFQSNSHRLSLPSTTFQNCTINFHVGSGATTSTIRKRRRAVIYDSDSD